MSKELNLTEIDDQHVELLPERAVMSLFIAAGQGSSSDPSNAAGTSDSGTIAPSRVSSPFTFGTYVSAASIASSDPTGDANVAGWGTLSSGGNPPTALPDM
jgi:hypothetical protein